MMTTLSASERLNELKERYAALLERREVFNAELLALKPQIDTLTAQLMYEQTGLLKNMPLWVTSEFMDWVKQHNPQAQCWFTAGEAVLTYVYFAAGSSGEVVGQVDQRSSGTVIGSVPLDILKRMVAAHPAVQS